MSTNFAALGVPEVLSNDLARGGITEAFPIQEKTLPDSLAGRDVLGRGRTGSGKTVAFALPVVARLAGLVPGTARVPRRANRPTALILAPTRELATQLNRTVEPLAKAAGLNTTVIFGGVSQKHQERALRDGVDIVVACPGRLEDLIKQGVLSLEDIRVTVLDEADHMADMGFLPVVTRLLQRTPQGSQRLLFSATLDNGVDTLVKKFLTDPVRHSADTAQAAVTTMDHQVLVVHADHKQNLIETLASGVGRRVMFTRTKHRAKKLAKKLNQSGIPAVDLQGNLSQGARDRNLSAFSNGDVRVLVATDVAARGVHVDDVELVVHIDPPVEHKSYLHRSGRTARAGASGSVITIATKEERSDVNQLMKKAGVKPQVDEVSPGSELVSDLVGERAARVAPQSVSPTAQPQSAPRGGNSGRSGRGGARSNSRGGSARTGESSYGGRRRSAGSGVPARQGGQRAGAPRTYGEAPAGQRRVDEQDSRPTRGRGPRRATASGSQQGERTDSREQRSEGRSGGDFQRGRSGRGGAGASQNSGRPQRGGRGRDAQGTGGRSAANQGAGGRGRASSRRGAEGRSTGAGKSSQSVNPVMDRAMQAAQDRRRENRRSGATHAG